MKGQAEFMEWFPRLIMLLAAIIIIIMLVRYFSDRDVDPFEVHSESYVFRLYNDDIIMYRDPTGRVYPGVVDFEKFRDETIIDTRYGNTTSISSRLMLTGCESGELYHNRDVYVNKKPFSQTIGPGGSNEKTVLYPVTIRNGGTTCPGMLNISVVRPNS